MELPALASVEGAYWYLIGVILLLALVSAVYLLGALAGYLPDPTRLLVLASVGPV